MVSLWHWVLTRGSPTLRQLLVIVIKISTNIRCLSGQSQFLLLTKLHFILQTLDLDNSFIQIEVLLLKHKFSHLNFSKLLKPEAFTFFTLEVSNNVAFFNLAKLTKKASEVLVTDIHSKPSYKLPFAGVVFFFKLLFGFCNVDVNSFAIDADLLGGDFFVVFVTSNGNKAEASVVDLAEVSNEFHIENWANSA